MDSITKNKIAMERLLDYERQQGDPVKELNKLWKEKFPEAANEESTSVKPFLKLSEEKQIINFLNKKTEVTLEQWLNDLYFVTKRLFSFDPVFKSGKMITLGIAALNNIASHDWRHFQEIKNYLVGEEVEAFELYPAESRLIDPSNYYTLWCFPNLKRINVGQLERHVLDQDEAIASQRKFAIK